MKCACSNRQKRLPYSAAREKSPPGTYTGDGKCRPGMFEYHLEGEIHHEFNRHGARYPSYNTIVGSGENGCILHYTENECELRDGDRC